MPDNPTGYLGVLPDENFEPETGYGWVLAAGGVDKGPLDGPNGDLRRDAHFGNGPNTFQSELPNGEYTLNVTVGDAENPINGLQFMAEGELVLADIDISAGVFQHLTFPATVTDGVLDFEISSLGDSPWVINGLEIRPETEEIRLSPESDRPADGMSAARIIGFASFVGAGFDPDNLFSVTTDHGALINDVSDEYAGHQVAAVAGTLEIVLQGPLSLEDVTTTITVTAVDGSAQGTTTVTFLGTGESPLQLAEGFAPTSNPRILSHAEAQPILEAAVNRLQTAGLTDEDVATLSTLTIEIVELNGNRLAESLPGVIRLDLNAAGIGWFIDPTPFADEEFAGENLHAIDEDAIGRVDLLSVIFHELLHKLGGEDLDVIEHPDHILAETLPPGRRRLPSADDFDQLFADRGILDDLLTA